jgi:hypothetical protein
MFTITSGEIAGSMLTRATPRLVATLIAAALVGRMFAVGTDGLDRAAAKWVDETLRRTSLDEKVGQLLASSMESTFTSTDSDVFDGLAFARTRSARRRFSSVWWYGPGAWGLVEPDLRGL